ncbi:TIGR04222 domain-containing membrane protein, partial [Streptomyces sp. URMC 129]|uniref:TIGR04222 domain-containing membrane protein n=1 Tax=Streptomyces sp. URMC 129 TaxID=3423407 RepID=UPI003F19A1FE
MTPIVVLVACVLALCLVRLGVTAARARRDIAHAAGGTVTTVYEAAFLTGGPGRVADTVLCAMRDSGRISIESGAVRVLTPVAHDELERELLARCGSWEESLRAVRTGLATAGPVREIDDRLAARGLRWSRARYAGWRTGQGFALALSLVLALLSLFAASAVLLLVAGAGLVAGSVLGPGRDGLTGPGRAARRSLRRANPFAPQGSAALVAVAGAQALPDWYLRAQLTTAARPLRVSGGTSSSSNSSGFACGSASNCGGGSSSCGSSGGGGGGCGASMGGSL